MLRRHFMINTNSGIPKDEIWYTSSDGNIVTPNNTDSFPTILSNTYVNGKGIIKFETNVTKLGNKAFEDCRSLSSITLPNGITNIGSNAFFRCYALTSVTIPDSVGVIAGSAFASCMCLTSINIPNSVIGIGNIIAGDTFNNCSSLTSVIIGNSVKTIAKNTFYNCTSLKNISYEDNIAQWNAITKGANWNYNIPATVVHCIDGDVEI